MLSLISGIIQLIFLILSKWGEKDAEKKAKKTELQKELTNAIKTQDTSALTATIGRINRLR
jgi:hypothetical protein